MGKVKNNASSEVLKDACRFKNEAAFESWVIEVLRLNGWLVTSMKDSRKQHWNTHKGVPDIIAACQGDLIFAELKMPGGKTTDSQWEWLYALGEANECSGGSVQVYLWRPENEDDIVRIAGGKRPLW